MGKITGMLISFAYPIGTQNIIHLRSIATLCKPSSTPCLQIGPDPDVAAPARFQHLIGTGIDIGMLQDICVILSKVRLLGFSISHIYKDLIVPPSNVISSPRQLQFSNADPSNSTRDIMSKLSVKARANQRFKKMTRAE